MSRGVARDGEEDPHEAGTYLAAVEDGTQCPARAGGDSVGNAVLGDEAGGDLHVVLEAFRTAVGG